MDQVEAQCAADPGTYDVETVRKKLQQHKDLKKGNEKRAKMRPIDLM